MLRIDEVQPAGVIDDPCPNDVRRDCEPDRNGRGLLPGLTSVGGPERDDMIDARLRRAGSLGYPCMRCVQKELVVLVAPCRDGGRRNVEPVRSAVCCTHGSICPTSRGAQHSCWSRRQGRPLPGHRAAARSYRRGRRDLVWGGCGDRLGFPKQPGLPDDKGHGQGECNQCRGCQQLDRPRTMPDTPRLRPMLSVSHRNPFEDVLLQMRRAGCQALIG
jgi:hypothetical protein